LIVHKKSQKDTSGIRSGIAFLACISLNLNVKRETANRLRNFVLRLELRLAYSKACFSCQGKSTFFQSSQVFA